MLTQTKNEKSPIVTISVCFPLPYAKILDAYRHSEKFSPSRSKVFQTVMEQFLDEILQKMPHLAEAIKTAAANATEDNSSVGVKGTNVVKALAMVQEAHKTPVTPAKTGKQIARASRIA